MNPSSAGIWCNPPPPGTELSGEELSNGSSKRDGSDHILDSIVDPYLKSSEYIQYKKNILSERSHGHTRERHKKRRSRSRSRGRHKHKRRHRSSSRSRSRSRRRHGSHAKKRNRYSRSHSRSKSKSRTHRSHKSERSRRSRSRHRSHSHIKTTDVEIDSNIDKKIVTEEEEEEEEIASEKNAFKNDGSFMEMFKKMQEEQQQKLEAEKTDVNDEKSQLPAFGKRRGGKVLKTGMVQKTKNINPEEVSDAQDAWTLYMKEVKRYKEACCDDDSKTRLLVK